MVPDGVKSPIQNTFRDHDWEGLQALLNRSQGQPQRPLKRNIAAAAQQTALDTVAALAASETIKVVAAQQSTAMADTMREALHQRGLDIQTNRAADGQAGTGHQPSRYKTPLQPPTHHSSNNAIPDLHQPPKRKQRATPNRRASPVIACWTRTFNLERTAARTRIALEILVLSNVAPLVAEIEDHAS